MEKAKRQSNFELLRIFAIILIVLYHIQRHGTQPLLTGNYGYFASPQIDPRLLVFEIGAPLGGIGNGLFIMISGYFINSNLHIDSGKIAKKLLLQLGFAVTFLIIANSVWVTFFKTEKPAWEPVTVGDFNNAWWFVGYYFLIIVLAKVFFNGFTAKLTQSQYKSLLLTVLAVSQFTFTASLLENLSQGLRNLSIGVFFFLMGGHIARYNPFKNVKAYTFLLAIAATYAVWLLSQYNSASQAIDEFIKSGNTKFVRTVQAPGNHGIIAVIIIICLFELFRRLNVPKNSVINFIGQSTLMIYLIHENRFFQMFYKDDSWMEALTTNVLAYCLMWMKWAVIAFAAGLAVYVLYTLFGKTLPRMRSLFISQNSND